MSEIDSTKISDDGIKEVENFIFWFFFFLFRASEERLYMYILYFYKKQNFVNNFYVLKCLVGMIVEKKGNGRQE